MVLARRLRGPSGAVRVWAGDVESVVPVDLAISVGMSRAARHVWSSERLAAATATDGKTAEYHKSNGAMRMQIADDMFG
jgi:hypothetical protein